MNSYVEMEKNCRLCSKAFKFRKQRHYYLVITSTIY
jgi:hypothetical protein